MAFIPEDVIARILERSDIVQLISAYTPLKRVGKNFKALCPFHHEKTPSFIVNPDKQIFHCFGCGVGGNQISFVMQQERLDFPEAVRLLAAKVGVLIPEVTGSSSESMDLRQQVFEINQWALEIFHECLLSGSDPGAREAREYLKKRGLGLDVVKKCRLGYAPDKWDHLLQQLRSRRVDLSKVEKAGLIVARDNGSGFYDRFRHRVIFPILDLQARCVAFGARALRSEEGAKYINSPETPVYIKGRHLYGFYLTKDAVREADEVVLVEGYMDFVVPFQSGVLNLAASLGTALTPEQIRLIRRYTSKIVFLFDGDSAGQEAMLRSLDLLIQEDMQVKVAVLGTEDDPDSFIRKFGIEVFKARLAEAKSVFDYKWQMLTGRYNLRIPEGKAAIAKDMLETIRCFPSAVTQHAYLKKLADQLGLPEETLALELRRIPAVSFLVKGAAVVSPVVAPTRAVEKEILRLLLLEESLLVLARKEILPSDFCDETIRSVVTLMFADFDEGKEMSATVLLNSLQDEAVISMISQLLAAEIPVAQDKEKLMADYIQRLKGDRLKMERQHLRSRILEAQRSGDNVHLEELTRQFNQLIKR